MPTTVTTTADGVSTTVVTSPDAAEATGGGGWVWQLTALTICAAVLTLAVSAWLLRKAFAERYNS
jgi:hypothetical protein